MLNWPCACSCNHAHVHARVRTHTYPEPSRVPAHLISLPSQHGEKPGVTNAPVPAEASSDSQSVCCFQTSWMSARIPFSPHSLTHPLTLLLTLSFSLSPFFFSFLLLTVSPALLSDLSFSPLSSVCTMHINYSEAVYWSLRFIQSELGSALMGSRCTCYRLQHTLEEAGG